MCLDILRLEVKGKLCADLLLLLLIRFIGSLHLLGENLHPATETLLDETLEFLLHLFGGGKIPVTHCTTFPA